MSNIEQPSGCQRSTQKEIGIDMSLLTIKRQLDNMAMIAGKKRYES
jgi:hypothetical protein